MVEDIRGKGLTKEQIKKLLIKIGKHYGYITETEVNTGFSKVDVVWFNEKVKPLWINRNKMLENSLAIPSVGFEIEERTFSRKPIRGDIDSLNSLFPQLGVLVFSDKIQTITEYKEQEKAVLKKHTEYNNNPEDDGVWSETQKRVKQHWDTSMRTFRKFVAASPHCRIVIWEEKDLRKITEELDIDLDEQ